VVAISWSGPRSGMSYMERNKMSMSHQDWHLLRRLSRLREVAFPLVVLSPPVISLRCRCRHNDRIVFMSKTCCGDRPRCGVVVKKTKTSGASCKALQRGNINVKVSPH